MLYKWWKLIFLLLCKGRREVLYCKCLFVYLSGGEGGRAAVSSVILAVSPVVDGVTPAIASKRLDTSRKQETVLMFFPPNDNFPSHGDEKKNDSESSQKTDFQ